MNTEDKRFALKQLINELLVKWENTFQRIAYSPERSRWGNLVVLQYIKPCKAHNGRFCFNISYKLDPDSVELIDDINKLFISLRLIEPTIKITWCDSVISL